MDDRVSRLEAPAMSRQEAVRRIRAGLRRRSGMVWSVTCGRGTAWGWLRITSPPARCIFGPDGSTPQDASYPSLADRQELADLLGFSEGPVPHLGQQVPATPESYAEFVARSEGRREAGTKVANCALVP